jgi:hypothetical protein
MIKIYGFALLLLPLPSWRDPRLSKKNCSHSDIFFHENHATLSVFALAFKQRIKPIPRVSELLDCQFSLHQQQWWVLLNTTSQAAFSFAKID